MEVNKEEIKEGSMFEYAAVYPERFGEKLLESVSIIA